VGAALTRCRQHRLRLGRVVLAAALLMVTLPPRASADLAAEMGQMFDGLGVSVPPGVDSTSREGMIGGGSIDVHNQLMYQNIISFVPPSFEAGCGGIDFYAGSFSFINAAQFTALLKSIAANAMGYAFQVALSDMCPTCMSVIDDLQRKIQQLNQAFSNSCQLAQGLVNDTTSAFTGQQNTGASLINTVAGLGDVFQSFTSATGTSPVVQAATSAPAQAAQLLQGNVVWRALVSQNVSSWFSFGDNALLQVMMNISGTVIVGALAPQPDGTGSANFQTSTYAPNPDLLSYLIQGGTVTIATCADGFAADQCLSLSQSPVTIQGFNQMLLQAFLGTGATWDGSGATSPGIILKVATGTPLTATEQQILDLLPDGIGGLIVRLASHSPDAATILALRTVPQTSLALARSLMMGLLAGVEAPVAGSQDINAPKVEKLITRARTEILQAVLALQARYGSLATVAETYRSLMQTLSAQPFAVPANIMPP
jgi:conjugative transfer pilus assembly protein TraH